MDFAPETCRRAISEVKSALALAPDWVDGQNVAVGQFNMRQTSQEKFGRKQTFPCFSWAALVYYARHKFFDKTADNVLTGWRPVRTILAPA